MQFVVFLRPLNLMDRMLAVPLNGTKLVICESNRGASAAAIEP